MSWGIQISWLEFLDEELTELPVGETPYDSSAKPIWELFDEMAQQIPEEELRKLPGDLSTNIDHYVYGFPKNEAGLRGCGT